MEFIIALVFLLLIASVVFFTLQQRKKKEKQNEQAFFSSRAFNELREMGFTTFDSNSIVGEFNSHQLGVYFLNMRSGLEYFTFINTEVPQKLRAMNRFNDKYRNERIAIDSREGFRQQIVGDLDKGKINESFERLIEIAHQEKSAL